MFFSCLQLWASGWGALTIPALTGKTTEIVENNESSHHSHNLETKNLQKAMPLNKIIIKNHPKSSKIIQNHQKWSKIIQNHPKTSNTHKHSKFELPKTLPFLGSKAQLVVGEATGTGCRLDLEARLDLGAIASAKVCHWVVDFWNFYGN